MTAELTLRYEFSSDPADDFGWLAVSVHTYAFTGRGGFWVQWQTSKKWLRSWMLTHACPRTRSWRNGGQCNSDGSNYEVIVGISIVPTNKTGDLDVIVHIADHHDTRRRCQTVFRTNYANTAKFAVELKALIDRQQDVAVLLGRDVG